MSASAKYTYFESEYHKSDSKSKEKFIKHFNVCDEEKAQKIYLHILFEIEKSIKNGKLDDLKCLNWYIDFISFAKPAATLNTYYSDAVNPFAKSNIIIFVCKHNGTNILEYLFSEECALINNLSINVKNDPILPDIEDDEFHNAFYYAICNNNCHLLETLVNKWPNDYFKRNPDELDQLLCSTYKELKLKNVALSDEIQVCVEAILINIHFYDNDPQEQNSNSIELIKERIQLVLESVNSLKSSYISTEEDENFLLIAKFIAQNLFILKRQVKCTYNKLPWEEMEFCLTMFVSSRIQRHELNLFYSFVLTKNKILIHLENFASFLSEEINNIEKMGTKKLSKIPPIKRKSIIDSILKNTPAFKELYFDYQLVRDLHSLETIKNYVNVAVSVDPNNEEECLIIKRTVQIIGEHLKNTLESPKLSDSSCELILSILSKNTAKIVADLRNAFSHKCSFINWQLVQANADADFFKNIHNDVKKISGVILKILAKNKIDILKLLLESIIKCETLDELENIMKILKDAELKDIFTQNYKFIVDEVMMIENLIEQIDTKITNKTTIEENLLCKIKQIIGTEKNKLIKMETDYVVGYSYLLIILKHFQLFKLDRNHMRGIKYRAKKTLECFASTIETENLKEISEDVMALFQISMNKTDVENFTEIIILIKKLFIHMEFQVGNVKWLDDLRRKLGCYKFAGIDAEISFEQKKDSIQGRLISELSSKLCTLKQVILKNSFDIQLIENFSLYKSNLKLKVIIETLVLDVLCILSDSNRLANNSVFLDCDIPLLVGQVLRNHLAHNNTLLNIFQLDCSIAVLINAKQIALENITKHCRQIGKVVKNDPLKLRIKLKRELKVVNLKKGLFDAIITGNIEMLQNLIKQGADVRERSLNLWTALHFAAMGGNVEIVKFLHYNLSVDDKDINGQTPLHIASSFGHTNIIKFLIKELNVNVNDTDNMVKIPLHLAAQNGHESAINLLLKYQSNIKVKDAVGCSPLFYAVVNNHKNAAQILLGYGSIDESVQLGGFTSLHTAAESGHFEIANLLLKKGANVDAKTDRQATALHTSALNGHVDIVKLLIRKGATVNMHTIDGGTPLHYAVENGHEKIVEILIKQGANVNAIDGCSYTPLNFAAEDGYFSIVKILVEHRADINNTTMNGATALHLAAKNGHLDIVEFLCNKKALLHLKDLMGFTALHYGCLNGHENVVNYLIEKGAKINATDTEKRMPLHLAALNGHIKVIEILISKGVDLNSTDAKGCSALHLSSANDKETVVEFLLTKGATVNHWNDFHFSALFLAIKNHNVKILQLLIAKGADINLINSLGLKALHFGALHGNREIIEELIMQNVDINDQSFAGTPLHLAVLNNTIEVVEVLIKNGALIDAKCKSGFTPLCFAAKKNDKEVVKMLIKNGANIYARDGYPLFSAIYYGFYDIVEILLQNEKFKVNKPMCNDITPLHLAAKLGHRVIVETLITKGADVNAVTAIDKTTPLHNAASEGAVEVVKILLRKKAKMNARSFDGSTPLHFAVYPGHANVVKLLIENGANVNIADYKNRTAIELAVAHGKLEIVKMLSELKSINIHDKANDGFSLLHIAADSGHLNIIKHLIEKGADINSENDAGTKPIHFAAREGYKDIVQFLLDLDPTGKHLTAVGQTPVHYSVLGGHIDILQFLIDRKFDINASSRKGVLPIHIAVFKNNENILKILLNQGAFYNAIFDGLTPLKIAQENNYVQCADLLVSVEKYFNAVKKNISDVESHIKNGIAVNVKNVDNITPLHYACWKGYENIVEILLKNKADPNILGKGNCTPLHYAAKFNHFTIVKSLLLHGGIYNAMSSNHKTPLDFTKHDDIKNLLQLVDESFKKVKNGNIEIIPILKKNKNKNILRCILNAHDQENKTLIVTGINSDFPKLKELKSLSQDGMSAEINRAYALCNDERYQDALSVIETVLEKRKKLFGEDSLETLESQQLQAKALYKLHKYHEALKLLESIYQKQKQLLGISNSDTLETRGSIALIFHRLGKDEEAITIFREILPKQKEILGSNHVKVLQTQSDMALALNAVGEYEEALTLNREVYKARKMIFHSNHPITLVSKNNIALVLLYQGKLDESLRIFKEVYEVRKKVLGPNHSDTLRTYSNITAVQAQMDISDDHSESFKDVLNLQKTAFGMQNRDTINTQLNMATNLFKQGKFHEAKKIYEGCVDSATTILGPNHTTVNFIKKMLEAIEFASAMKGQQDFSGILENYNITDLPLEDMYKMFQNTDKNVEFKKKDTDGLTELHYAVSEGSMIKVQNLLKTGVNLMATSNKGNTALHMAALKGYTDIVELLLKCMKENNNLKFSDFINAKTTGHGNVALHVAPNVKTALCLLKYGAIFNIKNKKDETPLDVTKNEDIQRILQLIPELFDALENSNERIINNISTLKDDEITAVLNAQNLNGESVLRSAALYQPSLFRELKHFLQKKKICFINFK
ncbi:Serine/threonine-protein phosphatase 6 regulatory ankyrin repeat subunit B [Araneus ventricosus]|uniref:Serine/threonine-protein phosphatase 6 regulatory ankyrin repeat subunit B n=1 Tax=Araneus ventricosus TaxID=182803 RepID=A0A4Y2AMW6_ARAVE|nr:Serine/threonine-protein phosphatase 6 regulatory ankyrin repeat subunit B [Araneus ventricosus]